MANQAENKGKRSATHEEQTNNKASQKNPAEIETDNDNWSQKLESLGSTLDGDLSVLSSEDALSLVDEWHDLLHKAKEPEIKEIATHLKQLKQLLKSNKATGHEISEVLMEVGEQTANFASDADKEIKTPIRQLGKKISKVGNSLGKAEDQEEIEEIDSLVETLEEDLTQIDTETAQGAVDRWYQLLHKSSDENLVQIADGLKELKQLLKRGNPKPANVSNLLARLGEQTTDVAQEAKRGFKGPIQRLGKLLSKAGKSLEE
ncbi:hypothetical protein [Nostoc sp. MG11]|uniref:hypothetical protein n=1 Tax=Nostoc sp. MG11 TaxID=2721166 RepID=UPI001866E926|nr:hypothetical protein [Nostoc sp. MG11]